MKSLGAGQITAEIEGDRLSLTWGRSVFSLTLFDVEQYPHLAEPSGPSVTLPGADLADALRRVVRAASTDDHRPILTGVRMEPNEAGGLRMVATDSYRLALSDLAGSGSLLADHKVLVPSRALNELVRALDKSADVSIRLGERDVTFEAGPVSLQTRLIDGDFPNYRQLIPSDYKNRLLVSKESFMDAVKRVKLMAADSKTIRIRMSSDGLELSAVNQEWGSATDMIDAEYSGEELTMAFNPDYLSAGLEGVPTDSVVLETQNAIKPAVLHGTDDSGYLYLLMPVREKR